MSQTYTEQAFRYFLTAERKRSQRSRKSFLLLLITAKGPRGLNTPMSRSLATAVFSALRGAIRDVDFIGWFREGRIAGAVLTQGTVALTSETLQTVEQRMRETLSGLVAVNPGHSLRVRIVELRPRQQD